MNVTTENDAVLGLRNKTLDMSMTVMSSIRALKEVKDETVKRKAQIQLVNLAQSCITLLGESAANDDDVEILDICAEILNTIGGKLND